MDGLRSILIFIIAVAILYLIIFYAVKFAIIEAHREINEQGKQALENKISRD